MKKPKHGRLLALGAVSLVPGRVRDDIRVATEVRDEVEELMRASSFLEGAPFSWVGVMLRYGSRETELPEYDRIDEADGELPVAVELDMGALRGASRERVKQLFMRGVLRALLDIGRRYQLNTRAVEQMLCSLAEAS